MGRGREARSLQSSPRPRKRARGNREAEDDDAASDPPHTEVAAPRIQSRTYASERLVFDDDESASLLPGMAADAVADDELDSNDGSLDAHDRSDALDEPLLNRDSSGIVDSPEDILANGQSGRRYRSMDFARDQEDDDRSNDSDATELAEPATTGILSKEMLTRNGILKIEIEQDAKQETNNDRRDEEERSDDADRDDPSADNGRRVLAGWDDDNEAELTRSRVLSTRKLRSAADRTESPRKHSNAHADPDGSRPPADLVDATGRADGVAHLPPEKLVVGATVACALASGPLVEAVIVARSPEEPLPPKRCYVHFTGFDRRLDRWVLVKELKPPLPKHADDKDRAAEPLKAESEGSKGPGQSTARGRAGLRSGAGQPKVTRSRRRALEEFNPVSEKEVGNEVVAQLEQAREEHTKIRNIATIVLGTYDVDVWYFSPYPGKYGQADRLYICEFCLKYMISARLYDEHCRSCTWTSPPGARIYSDAENKVTVYEVDGLVNAPYCQRLCLLGKLFLDHKTLYFDVAPFYFYVILHDDELAGFFSKEKPLVASEFNLACIVTMPQHQRKGLGRFLIALSYELTKREGKTGSPERPLSDLGQVSYRSYWMHAVMSYIRSKRGAVGISAGDVANATGIRVSDVVTTLKSLGVITIWKGETYVDSNPKALEQAQRRIRDPRLPFRGPCLTWGVIKRPDAAAPSTSPRSPFPSPAPAATSSAGKAARSRKQRGRASSAATPSPVAGNESGAGASASAQGKAGGASSGVVAGGSGAFSDEEVNAMKEFILLHSAGKVYAPLNTEHGLQSADVQRLAESLNMTMERCRKKLKRMSAAALNDPTVLMAGRDVPMILAAPLLSPSAQPSDIPTADSQKTHAAKPELRPDVRGPGFPHIESGSDMMDSLDAVAGMGLVENGAGVTVRTPESLTEAVDGGVTPAASPDIDFERGGHAMHAKSNGHMSKDISSLKLDRSAAHPLSNVAGVENPNASMNGIANELLGMLGHVTSDSAGPRKAEFGENYIAGSDGDGKKLLDFAATSAAHHG